MKSEVLIPVVAAIIAAFASIGGILYSQNATLDLERYKFQQTKAEEIRKLQATALADFAREFATAYQRSAYLIWQVEMAADSLKVEDFTTYDKEVKAHMPKLVASHIALATYGKSLYEQTQPYLNEYYALDERIAVAGRQFQKNRAEGLKALEEDVRKIKSFEDRMGFGLAAAGESLAAIANTPK